MSESIFLDFLVYTEVGVRKKWIILFMVMLYKKNSGGNKIMCLSCLLINTIEPHKYLKISTNPI